MSSWQLCCHTRPATAVVAGPTLFPSYLIEGRSDVILLFAHSGKDGFRFSLCIKWWQHIYLETCHEISLMSILNQGKSNSIDPCIGVRQLGQFSRCQDLKACRVHHNCSQWRGLGKGRGELQVMWVSVTEYRRLKLRWIQDRLVSCPTENKLLLKCKSCGWPMPAGRWMGAVRGLQV